jgi:tetratricopeptide (TPR) repeat protein
MLHRAGLLLLLLLALPAAAYGEQDETGPNFALPDTVKPEVMARYDEAVKAFREAHEAKKDQTAKTEAAVKKLLALRKEAPELPQVCYYLGIAYQITKEFAKARGVLETAVELNPKFHQALIELGDVYIWLKQPDKAMPWYEKALALAPDYAHGYLMRGLARLRRGDAKGAAADLERAQKLGAKDSWLALMLELARRADAPPWPGTVYVRESANYVVRTPVSQEVADDISLHAEAIHETYSKIFPKIKKERRKFEIFVYASKEDYHANGGPPSAAGHYDTMLRRLHIYTHEKDADTKLTLYHEGFHQFLHDYLEDAPQWFNEGLGDFFGPTEYQPKKDTKGKVTGYSMRLRPNPWRLQYIQAMIQRGRVRSWRQLMLMSQAELYDEEWAGVHYAQAWSIIYFLIRGSAAPDQTAGPYFELLKSYFAALRKGDGQGEAFEKTFGKQDLPKLEAEWRKFILKLGPEG